MENKKKIKIFFAMTIVLAAIFSFVSLLPPLTSATISCSGTCFVSDCTCIITDCSNGIFDVYTSSSCSGIPTYEFSFGARSFGWYPPTAGTYYAQVVCDDGTTRSSCAAISVKSAEETITTTSETTTTTTTTSGGGGDNTWLIILAVLIIIGIVAFLIYRFFFSGKKGARKTYEELYRKWGSRPA